MQKTINVAGLTSPEAIHDAVAIALALPDYYGKNLDALWDCLGDLEMPLTVSWQGEAASEDARSTAQAIRSLFAEFAAEEPGFRFQDAPR